MRVSDVIRIQIYRVLSADEHFRFGSYIFYSVSRTPACETVMVFSAPHRIALLIRVELTALTKKRTQHKMHETKSVFAVTFIRFGSSIDVANVNLLCSDI